LVLADDLGGELVVEVPARVGDVCVRPRNLDAAFSLFLLPCCLRARSRWAFFSFFSARRRKRGALPFVPSSMTAK
jgi:hypothetical protein